MDKIKFVEEQVSSALHPLKRKIPYGWDLNIYRGCQHGCTYCYAMYSHGYLNSTDFFREIHAKTNIVEELEKELRKPSWKREVINIGGVTDSYQPAEEKYQFMSEILKLLIRYKTPAIISTKSTGILRDYDLIDQLSRITYVNVAETITTMDENVRKKIEPFGAESRARFEVLKAFRKTNASVGLHVMPIIPYITDSKENLEELCAMAADAQVHYLLPGTLYLKGPTKKVFLDFVDTAFPEKAEKLRALYRTGGAGEVYKNQLYGTLNPLREKYRISSSYTKPMKEKLKAAEEEGTVIGSLI